MSTLPGRTLVFCTSYVAHEVAWQQRYLRWLQHHSAIDWGDAVLAMVDDASPFIPPATQIQCHATDALPAAAHGPLMLRFSERLGRPAPAQYPGWWRSFLYSSVAASRLGCDKIVHIESDTYVLTQRMTSFIRELRSGWTGFWCPRWNFPETCVQVICKDQFPTLHSMWTRGWQHYSGQLAERIIPFTQVVREPHGNRYGEMRTRIPSFADFAAQVGPQHRIWYR
jgi:hypothetical protein